MATTRRRLIGTAGALASVAALAGRQAFGAPAKPKPMNILILGGTGFTGPHQVAYALARGHKVTVFNRGRQGNPWPGQVEELLGDRNTGDLKTLEGRSWDVCIDNPTTLPFWVRDAGKVLAGKVGQYIFISTISVYASNAIPNQDETAPTAPYTGADPMAETLKTLQADMGGLYGPLKAVSEQEARRQFGAETTIIRPGLIVGPGDDTDRFTYWPVRLARGGEVLAPGDGADPVQFIDARDLAEWTIRMAEARGFGVFNATGPAHTLTTKAMLTTMGEAVRSTAHLNWAPTAFLDAQKVNAWSDMPVWIPGQGDTAGFARRSIARALAAGLTFRPLPATAADNPGLVQEPAAGASGQAQSRPDAGTGSRGAGGVEDGERVTFRTTLCQRAGPDRARAAITCKAAATCCLLPDGAPSRPGVQKVSGSRAQ